MKYNVHVYHVMRSKVCGIEADTHEAAMKKADELFSENYDERENAEEVTGYLVDEENDDEYLNTRMYDAEYNSENV